MPPSPYLYIAVMAAVTLLIRVLPLTLIRGQITNRFVRSFLFYVPYVTLAVMTFPAIVESTNSPVAGAVALVAGIAAAWSGASLVQVAVGCCAIVCVLVLLRVWRWGVGSRMAFLPNDVGSRSGRWLCAGLAARLVQRNPSHSANGHAFAPRVRIQSCGLLGRCAEGWRTCVRR